MAVSLEIHCTVIICLVFVQEEVRAKVPKYQRQAPVKTVDSSTSTPQPQVEVCTNKYLNKSSHQELYWGIFFIHTKILIVN
jgi:hypothetical protein